MIDAQRLYGHWRQLHFIEKRGDGQWVDARGPNAKGALCYLPSGHVQVLQAAIDRPRLRGAWGDIPPAHKAACLDGMVAYCGRFTLGPDRVTHHLDICWIPNWEGRDLVRLVSFPREDQLLLRTVPRPGDRNAIDQEVLWARCGPWTG